MYILRNFIIEETTDKRITMEYLVILNETDAEDVKDIHKCLIEVSVSTVIG